MNEDEYELQIQGYIDAFESASIRDRITSLSKGVAISVNTWGTDLLSSSGFFHLTNEASIDTFISTVLDNLLLNRQGTDELTNIATGIDESVNGLLNNDFQGERLVIDISGDGKQNVRCNPRCRGTSFGNGIAIVEAARDNAIANGITINGLPILTDFGDLDTYYTDYVIGGDKRFLIAANDFPDFANAVEQKIEREIVPPGSESTPEPTSLLGLGLIGLEPIRKVIRSALNRVSGS